MRLAVLFNRDYDREDAERADDPGLEARADVARVADDVVAALASRPAATVRAVAAGDDLRFVDELRAERPDVVVNLCESLWGDARGEPAIPQLLDAAGLAYTGNTGLALSLALHKEKAKDVLRARGVPTPEAALLRDEGDLAAADVPFPAIVKPAREDASIGIDGASVVRDRKALAKQAKKLFRALGQELLVERYVEGREVNAAILGGAVLPLGEIDFAAMPKGLPKIVTYAAKWRPGSPEDLGTRPRPCTIDDPRTLARIEEVARAAFEALGLRDYGRVDLRVDDAGEPFVIDVNPNCDLARDAGFARAAARAGLSYEALVGRLVELARERHASPRAGKGRPAVPRVAALPHRELHAGRGGHGAGAPRGGARQDP